MRPYNLVIFILCFLYLSPSISRVYGIYEEYFKIDQNVTKEILEINKPILQHFTSYSDFGSIEVKFTHSHSLKGQLLFTLSNSKGNIYENIYPLDKIQSDGYFPFGFPIVRISPQQNYKFSLTLLTIEKGKSLSVWKNKEGIINYKVSGERSLFSSLRFFFIHNITNDMPFFIFYSILILIVFSVLLLNSYDRHSAS